MLPVPSLPRRQLEWLPLCAAVAGQCQFPNGSLRNRNTTIGVRVSPRLQMAARVQSVGQLPCVAMKNGSVAPGLRHSLPRLYER